MIVKPNTAGSHWARHAAQWGKVGSPLRPIQEDIDLYWRAINSSVAESELAMARVLLLGVTPELTSLRWPVGSSLFACDSSLDMLQSIWPLGRFPGASASTLNANWLALPLAPGACNLVVGDGSLSVFDCADDYRRCAHELYRVLQPGGCVVLRLFCPPEVPESPEQVFADLRRGHVGNFHAFKWRLVMAIHASNESARLADIWARWESEFPEPELAAALSGHWMRFAPWRPIGMPRRDTVSRAWPKYARCCLRNSSFSMRLGPAMNSVNAAPLRAFGGALREQNSVIADSPI